MRTQRKIWIFIALYIALIYATLPLARLLLNALYWLVGNTFLGLLTNFTLGAVFAYVTLRLHKKLGKKSLIYALMGTALLITIIMSLDRPEERIHFIEYGVLGFLFVKAFNSVSLKTLTMSVFLTAVVGTVDEVIQGFLPNRVGDIRDAFMNAIGGFLGVWFAKLYYS